MLRPYQERIIEEVRDEYRRGARAPLIVSPTGSGKTVMFCYVAAQSALRNRRVWILVHRIELVRQTSRALTAQCVEHDVVIPGHRPNPRVKVLVASVQTLVQRLSHMEPPDTIVIDEAHHAVAGTWGKILTWAGARSVILGVTATPMRLDGKGLGKEVGGWFDAMVIGPSTAELVSQGFLARPRVFAGKNQIDMAALQTSHGDYTDSSVERVMMAPDIVADSVKHYREKAAGVPSIAFCSTVSHAEQMADQYRAAGINAESIDGTNAAADRDRKLRQLAAGEIQILTSCALISEGFDAPAVGGAILLRPTKSLAMYLQQVGRALRPAPGKDSAIILDHARNALTHGLPTDDREWSLEGRVKRDREPGVKTCDSCLALVPVSARVCPECGAEFEVRERGEGDRVVGDDEMVELTPEQMAAIKVAQNRQRLAEQGACETFDDLVELGKRRGYSKPHGWASRIWGARQARQQRPQTPDLFLG